MYPSDIFAAVSYHLRSGYGLPRSFSDLRLLTWVGSLDLQHLNLTKFQAELDEQVYLWAHIEAYSSLITACLPTLSPLFLNMRSLDSIVGSVRSVLSIRSKASSIFKPSGSDDHSQRSQSSDTEKTPWNNSEGPTSTAGRGRNIHDLESQVHNTEVIMVEKTFVSGSAREVK